MKKPKIADGIRWFEDFWERHPCETCDKQCYSHFRIVAWVKYNLLIFLRHKRIGQRKKSCILEIGMGTVNVQASPAKWKLTFFRFTMENFFLAIFTSTNSYYFCFRLLLKVTLQIKSIEWTFWWIPVCLDGVF